MRGKLYLSEDDKKIAGVCGGIAHYFNLESALVRVFLVLLVLLFRYPPVIIYLILWAVLPKEA